jgi:RsiW-degrading membrane proteinase PrsW (M82 family)
MTSAQLRLSALDPADRRFAQLGLATVALTLVVVTARLTGVLPAGWATAIVLVGLGIGLRVGLIVLARTAGADQRARTLRRISLAGLAVGGLAAVSALPVITRNGGGPLFVKDAATFGWTLLLVAAAAESVRTMNWRTFVGLGLTAFLGIIAVARAVVRPIVLDLGDNPVGPALIGPLVETILELTPVALIALLVAHRRQTRASALDLTLLGAFIGAGYALNENTLFGRGGGDWGVAAPLTLLSPGSNAIASPWTLQAGHLVWTALGALGIAITALYRRRLRFAAWAAPMAIALLLAEHVSGNLAVLRPHSSLLAGLRVITAGGCASLVLLVAGIGLVLRLEVPAVRGCGRSPLWVTPELAGRRGRALARLQGGTS